MVGVATATTPRPGGFMAMAESCQLPLLRLVASGRFRAVARALAAAATADLQLLRAGLERSTVRHAGVDRGLGHLDVVRVVKPIEVRQRVHGDRALVVIELELVGDLRPM